MTQAQVTWLLDRRRPSFRPSGPQRPSPRRGRPAQTPAPERELRWGGGWGPWLPHVGSLAAPKRGPGGPTAAHGLGLPAAPPAAPPPPVPRGEGRGREGRRHFRLLARGPATPRRATLHPLTPPPVTLTSRPAPASSFRSRHPEPPPARPA